MSVGKSPKYTGQQQIIENPDNVGVFFCTTRDRLLKILSVLQQGAGSYPDDLFASEVNGGFEDRGHIYDIENALAYLNNPLESPCAQEYQPPFYEDENDSGGVRNGEKTFEIIGDYVIEGFLMTFTGPLGVVAYRVINGVVRFFFGTTIGGAMVRILINGLEYAVYELTDSETLAGYVVSVAEFLLSVGQEFVPEQTPVWIEIEQVPQIEQEQYRTMARGQSARQAPLTGNLQIGRGNIKYDGDTMFKLRQSEINPFLLEQTNDGETWTEAYDYSALGRGSGGMTSSEQNEYFNEINNIYESNDVVNNTTINNWTELDGRITDDAKRQALCMTIQSLIISVHETMRAGGEKIDDWSDLAWLSLDLASSVIGAVISRRELRYAKIPVVGKLAFAVAVVNVVGDVVRIVATALQNKPSDVVANLDTAWLDSLSCAVLENLSNPITQAGVSNALFLASEEIDRVTDDEILTYEIASALSSEMANNRGLWVDVVNVWGDLARNMISLGVVEVDGCACWDAWVMDYDFSRGTLGWYLLEPSDRQITEYVNGAWRQTATANIGNRVATIAIDLPELVTTSEYSITKVEIFGRSNLYGAIRSTALRAQVIGGNSTAWAGVTIEPPTSGEEFYYVDDTVNSRNVNQLAITLTKDNTTTDQVGAWLEITRVRISGRGRQLATVI